MASRSADRTRASTSATSCPHFLDHGGSSAVLGCPAGMATTLTASWIEGPTVHTRARRRQPRALLRDGGLTSCRRTRPPSPSSCARDAHARGGLRAPVKAKPTASGARRTTGRRRRVAERGARGRRPPPARVRRTHRRDRQRRDPGRPGRPRRPHAGGTRTRGTSQARRAAGTVDAAGFGRRCRRAVAPLPPLPSACSSARSRTVTSSACSITTRLRRDRGEDEPLVLRHLARRPSHSLLSHAPHDGARPVVSL